MRPLATRERQAGTAADALLPGLDWTALTVGLVTPPSTFVDVLWAGRCR